MFGTVVIKGKNPQDLATKIKRKLDAIVPQDYSISTFIDSHASNSNEEYVCILAYYA